MFQTAQLDESTVEATGVGSHATLRFAGYALSKRRT